MLQFTGTAGCQCLLMWLPLNQEEVLECGFTQQEMVGNTGECG